MIEKLKIIASDRIISFEHHSPERTAKLARDIERDGKLRNPLLVYPLDGQYLMLDDSSILEALRQLGAIHIPVQLAETTTLSVHPWQRVVEKWMPAEMMEFCVHFPRQIRVEKASEGGLRPSQIEVRFRDGSRQRLTFVSRSYLVRVDICARFFHHLTTRHKSYRVKLDYHEPDVLGGFAEASAAIFPPAFSLSELSDIGIRHIKLPQGIVRIDQPNRVLGIDYLLSILAEDVPAGEKESFLKQLLIMRMSSDRVAYYNGGVFMFNN
jgi:hypothetical protein